MKFGLFYFARLLNALHSDISNAAWDPHDEEAVENGKLFDRREFLPFRIQIACG